MKYRDLPLERRLQHVLETEGQTAADKIRDALALELLRCEGFQLVTALLRHLEDAALRALRVGSGNTDRLVGRLQCIEEIRRSLSALVPDGQRQNVDWFDDQTEEFLLVDHTDLG